MNSSFTQTANIIVAKALVLSVLIKRGKSSGF